MAEKEAVVPEPVTKGNKKRIGWKGWVMVAEGEEIGTKAEDGGSAEGNSNSQDRDGIGSGHARRSLRNKRKSA